MKTPRSIEVEGKPDCLEKRDNCYYEYRYGITFHPDLPTARWAFMFRKDMSWLRCLVEEDKVL